MQNFLIAAVIAAVIAAFGGWSVLHTQNPSAQNPVKIGVAIPLTGIASIVGEAEKNGIKLAAKEINAKGGIDGRPIQLVIEDDATDPTKSVSAVQKLISVDRVDVLIGGTWDFLANAVVPVLDQSQKVMITASTLPDTLQKTSPFLFEDYSPVASNQAAVEKFLSGVSGKNVVTISVNNTWGQAHLAMFRKAAEASGKTVAKEAALPNFDNNDLQRELTLVKPLHPDAILVALNFGDSPDFLAKKAALGVSGAVLAHYNLKNAYENGGVSANLLGGVTIFTFSDPTSGFESRYADAYGSLPPDYADTAYDAVYLFKQAIENEGGKADTQSVIAGLRKITDYEGASGRIDLSVNNYPENKIPFLEKFNGSKFIAVQ